ncbi:MAG: amidophosphoribosyltransferase [Clostridia bacterium]|nr:amidophosphoribosyltransferase [Clostridia bacterium]
MPAKDDELFGGKIHEECGVFGIYGKGLDVSRLAYYALYALQHRGQESAGILVSDGEKMTLKKGIGLVSDVFTTDTLTELKGHLALGHVNYSSVGVNPHEAQPLIFQCSNYTLGVGNNGSIINAAELKAQLAGSGSIFQTNTDSELVANLIARYSRGSLEDALIKSMIDMKGAYCLTLMTEDTLIAVRDPYGFHPLCYGTIGEGCYVVASESCALDVIGAKFVRDVAPGEIIIINEQGLHSIATLTPPHRKHCVFEYVYLARPDSILDGFNVSRTRREFGHQLAREYPVEADVVISVPDSGTVAARGYTEQSGIPFEEGLTKNRYIGRTFIQPTQDMRNLAVRLKLNPIKEAIAGKRVVMVDDSLVRGTTSRNLVTLLKEVGAKEVHLCLSSPPVMHACYYGIDTTNEKELVAVTHSVEEIRQMLGADGLHYLSQEGMLQAFGDAGQEFCCACFDGKYPTGNCCVAEPKKKEKNRSLLGGKR